MNTRQSVTKFYPGFTNQMIVDFCNENNFRLISFERDETGYVDVFFEHSHDSDSPYVTMSRVELKEV